MLLIMAKCADFEWAEVGRRIRARRLALNRTQQQLAEKAGLTQNAIFRLEAGDTNPQISTLRVVAKALGTTARELVCGIVESDPRLGDRLVVVRRILESGDGAAIRAMDYGLENAQTVLDRTSGFWDKKPVDVGGRYRRSAPTSSAGRLRLPRNPDSEKEEIELLTKNQVHHAPHLRVGNAGNIALPKSNPPTEQHERPTELSAREDSASSRS